MWTSGKDARSAEIPRDIYRHTIGIIGDAEGVASYRSLCEQDAFAAEYWGLELYKLTLAPPEKELARRIALVTGAAGGIGSAIAERFAAQGAHVVIADLDGGAARRSPLRSTSGVAGNALGLADGRDAARSPFGAGSQQIARAYGGLDILVSNAGIAPTGRIEDLALETWERAWR